MIPRQLLQKPNSILSSSLPSTAFARSRPLQRRLQSSNTKTQARAARVLDRVPRFLRPYTERLRTAPVSHLVSFLILHEITAVIPLIGLASYFHYSNWLPSRVAESETLKPGIEKFGRYFRRKGWFGLDQEEAVDAEGPAAELVGSGDGVREGQGQEGHDRAAWGASPGARIVVEVAAAYAITKALLPLRLILSVWATPWFARVVIGKVWGGIRGIGRGRAAVGTTAGSIGPTTTGNGTHGAGKDIPKP